MPVAHKQPGGSPVRGVRAELSRHGGVHERQERSMQGQRSRSIASDTISIMIVRTGSDRISECRIMKEIDSTSDDCAWIARLRLLLQRLMLCCCHPELTRAPVRRRAFYASFSMQLHIRYTVSHA